MAEAVAGVEAGAEPAPGLASRSYDYPTAHLGSELILRHAGLELVTMMLDGRLPGSPFWRTVGGILTAVEPGCVTCEADVAAFAANFRGAGHGGWLATLMDTALGLAIMTELPPGRIHTTTELSLRYVRAVRPAVGRVRVIGRVLHAGRRMSTAEAQVLGASDGKLYAHGQTSCMILKVDQPAAAAPATPSAPGP